MRRKPRPSSSRDRAARRLVWALGLGLAGVIGGALLGFAVVNKGLDRAAGSDASFAGLSANPDALVTEQADAPPCPDCADSYGVAARLNARHDRRVSDAFRELGQVDDDVLPPPEPADDYRYGGRLPDPAPRPEPPPRPEQRDGPAMVIPVAPPPPPVTLSEPAGKPQQKGPGEPPEPPAVPQ